MDNKYGISESACYLFEYSFDVGVKTEALKIINGDYIESDTYIARHFIDYFLFSYYRIGKHLGCEPFKNPFQKPYDDFGAAPVLKQLLKNALCADNREKTKIYFENIALLLKNKECHNEKALKCLCEFMNVKMPEYESDLINDIPIELYANQDNNHWFNYLKENTKPIKRKHKPIIAEGNVGFDNVNIVYKINSLLDLWLASLYILFNLNGTIKICRNCGKPFVLYNQKNRVYCSDNNSNCVQEGRKARERERYNSVHIKLYKNIRMKLKYKGDTCLDTVSSINEWEQLAKKFSEKYKDYKKKKISDDKIIEWLKSVDMQYKNHKNTVFELPDIEKE